MILGYEDPVVMPSMHVYDTDLMKAYIAGVKEQYDNAQNEMKDFMKQYLDFYSPIAGDTEAYHNMTDGGARLLVNNMYANGLDPFKNPQARALISQYINRVPTAELNKMKQSAENAQMYLQNKAKLLAAGKWNQAYEDYLLGGRSLDNWDTSKDGVWNRVSPNEYTDLFDSTNPWFEGLQDSYLGTSGGYDYTGVTDALMAPIVNQQMTDFLNSDIGKFHYGLFKNTRPVGESELDTLDAFKNEIMAKNSKVKRTKRDENKFAVSSYESGLRMAEKEREAQLEVDVYNQKQDADWEREKKRLKWMKAHPGYGTESGKKSSKSSSGSGGGDEEDNAGEFGHLEQIDDSNVRGMAKKYRGTRIRIKGKDGTYNYYNAIEDKNGPHVTKDGRHWRLATEQEVQKNVYSRYKTSQNAWDLTKQYIEDGHLESTGVQNTAKSHETSKLKLTESNMSNVYDIDHIMNNAYGANFKEEGDSLKLRKYLATGNKSLITEKPYVITVILGKSGNRKAVYQEFEYKGEDENTKKAAYKLGLYILKDGDWIMDPKYATRMTEWNKRFSKGIVSEKGSVDISNR